MKIKISLSQYILLIICIAIVVCKFIFPPINVLTWDVFGYYLYLPAQFIYHDLALTNQAWLTELLTKYEPTGTLYQAVLLENGNWILKYSMGMSIIYAPFFFVAHLMTGTLGFPADGLSLPYQFSIAFGALIFTFIGLIYFRKILLNYFNDLTTSLLLIIIVFGTNYFQLNVFEGALLSHNILFTFYGILIWNTIKWHKNPKLKNAIFIGIASGFIILIRPAEVICILIPILWNIKNKETLIQKIELIKKNFVHILSIVVSVFIIGLPQIIYWKLLSGKFLYYSYTNAGEGFDFLSPHILNFLLDFRKGWFIYTPIMIFSLIGFYHLYKKKKEIFYAILVFFLLDLWIISSWTCWWYAGASFSSRSLVPAYLILSIPLGFLIENIIIKKKLTKIIFSSIFFMLIVLNLFQSWQFITNVLSKTRMTKEYYFAIFGKTSVSEKDKKLLLVERSSDGEEFLKNEEDYNKKLLCNLNFEKDGNTNLRSYDGKGAFLLNEKIQFSPGIDIKYKDLTKKSHVWIRSHVFVFLPEAYDEELPLLVATFNHKEKSYKYKAVGIKPDNIKYNDWNKISFDYLSPEVRSTEDNLLVYVWHRGKDTIFIDALVIDAFEPK